MNLAIKEIRHQKKKYVLVEVILILLIFMVLFLSGLANGLGRAVSAAIENMPAEEFILSADAENMLSLSNISAEEYETLVQENDAKNPMAGFSIFRSTVKTADKDEKNSIVYMGVESSNFLNPDVVEGSRLSGKEHEIVLDTSFRSVGYDIGDKIEDSVTGYEYTVVGFTKDAMYSHVAAGYISENSFETLRQLTNPAYQLSYNAIASNDALEIGDDTMSTISKDEVIDNLPGYLAEQMTIRMILWVLVVISAVILGVFFYILTLQKQNEFGVLKAIGMRMSEINQILITQILLLASFGVVIGNLLAFVMALFLPDSMPFYLQYKDAGILSLVFIGISLLFGLFSTRQIAKVDPLTTIGGMNYEA